MRRPDAEERASAARTLDAAGALGPDQRLLRVLLDDDREAFESALLDRLAEHRAGVGADPEPRTLLPVGAVALAALAHLAHGWEPGVRSGYLPEALLRGPVAA
ncbi:immunity 49 family protein [Streptomyces zaomyceticus]|uniref:Imm49 family immunity protein n=1 Tax=Streptomyces zaomyceticus TaxID=68286 RepID=UPI0032546819